MAYGPGYKECIMEVGKYSALVNLEQIYGDPPYGMYV